MNEDASNPKADSEDDLGREAARFKRQLQQDVQSWFANESGPSERQRNGQAKPARVLLELPPAFIVLAGSVR
jgi:hypothetical protein